MSPASQLLTDVLCKSRVYLVSGTIALHRIKKKKKNQTKKTVTFFSLFVGICSFCKYTWELGKIEVAQVFC